MDEKTLSRLKDLAEGLGPIYTTNDDSDYGCYYTDDIGNTELILSGVTDPVTRNAIKFMVEAVKAVLGHDAQAYHDHP